MKRNETRKVQIGPLTIGGNNHLVIQSMCSIKTSKIEEVSAQINRCAALGAELMRLSVLDVDDAKAFKEIKKRVSIPLVADIHIDYRLALVALDSGVDAIRINPGNIGSEEHVIEVINKAKEKHAPIRIGVNGGSLDKSIYFGKETIKGQWLFESAKKHVEILEKHDFHDAWRIFGYESDLPFDQLPRDTTLRKAYADWLSAGNKGGSGFGLIAFDGDKILK